jgi:hypothetical protein
MKEVMADYGWKSIKARLRKFAIWIWLKIQHLDHSFKVERSIQVREKIVRWRQVRLRGGMGWRFPAQFGAEAQRVDDQQQETRPAGIKGICDPDDLLLRRAVDEAFRLQAGGAVLAGILRGKPFISGSQVQDQGSTS